MKPNDFRKDFIKRVQRGRKFEKWERSKWTAEDHEKAETEAYTKWKGKKGRVDLRLIDDGEGHTIIVEIKATDWDAMDSHRVRPNALRHARQLWRYIEAELVDLPVLPAVVYPSVPKTPKRKEEIEAIFHEQLIQVVWRDIDLENI